MVDLQKIVERWSVDKGCDVMLPWLGSTTCGEAAESIAYVMRQIAEARVERDDWYQQNLALQRQIVGQDERDAELSFLKAERNRLAAELAEVTEKFETERSLNLCGRELQEENEALRKEIAEGRATIARQFAVLDRKINEKIEAVKSLKEVEAERNELAIRAATIDEALTNAIHIRKATEVERDSRTEDVRRLRRAMASAIDLVDRDIIRVRSSDRDEFFAALSDWNAALAEKDQQP